MRPVELEANDPTHGWAYVLPDGGARLRQFAANRGCELELVESSETSCTVRASRGPIDSHPLVVTYTAEDMHRAELDEHPESLADRQRFLAAWATRDAAGWHLADVVLDFDEERMLEPLGVKLLASNATSSEYGDHVGELTEAVKAYRQQRTLSGRFASASTVSCTARSGAWRETARGPVVAQERPDAHGPDRPTPTHQNPTTGPARARALTRAPAAPHRRTT